MTAGRAAPPGYGAMLVPGRTAGFARGGRPRAVDETDVIAPVTVATTPPAQQALEALPSVQRRALVLRHARGMAPHEIAAFDGVPVDVVDRRLAHGALAFSHHLGVPAGHTSPGAVAAREVAALGPRAELPPVAPAPTTWRALSFGSSAATAAVPVVEAAPDRVDGPGAGPTVVVAPVVAPLASAEPRPVSDVGPATTPPLDEPRDRRLPIAAACLAAASAAALGVAAATANGLDIAGFSGFSGFSGEPDGPAAGAAPGLGAVIPGPGAVGPAAPVPSAHGTDDLGLPAGAPSASGGAAPPSLAAANAPAPAELGAVPGVGAGPVGGGPVGAGSGGGPVVGSGGGSVGGSVGGGPSSPASSSTTTPPSSSPSSSTPPPSSPDPSPSSPTAEPTRDDPPPRANASSGGRGGDRADAGRGGGRGGDRGDRGDRGGQGGGLRGGGR